MTRARNPIAARAALFSALALLLSWGYWGWMLATGRQVHPGGTDSHLPGLMGPMIAAFVTLALTEGRAGVRRLAADCLRWPARPVVVAVLIVLPLALAALWFAVGAALGMAPPPAAAFLAYPGLPAGLAAPVALLAVLVLNGYGEEVGWRGYLLPLLLPRLGRVGATLAVSAVWLLWHLPLFWVNASMAGLIGPMLIGWAIGLILGAFVLAHLFLLSNHSLPAVVAWHVAYNFAVATGATQGMVAAVVSSLVMLWGLAIAVAWGRGLRLPQGIDDRSQ